MIWVGKRTPGRVLVEAVWLCTCPKEITRVRTIAEAYLGPDFQRSHANSKTQYCWTILFTPFVAQLAGEALAEGVVSMHPALR